MLNLAEAPDGDANQVQETLYNWSPAGSLVFWFLLCCHVGALPLSSPRTPAAVSGAGFGGAQPPSNRFVFLPAYSLGV